MPLNIFLSLLLLLSFKCFSQNNGSLIFKGATLHIGNGQYVKDAVLEINNGKIATITSGMVKTGNNKIVDVTGKHIYPGLISLYTSLGLTEIDYVRATNDHTEVGELNANVRSIVAYNAESDIIPTLRSNGILFAQITPRGGLISGNSSVVKLTGGSWQEAIYKTDEGIHLNWPSYYTYSWQNEESRAAHDKAKKKQIEVLDKFFTDATSYLSLIKPAHLNVRFEATSGLFDGTKTLYLSVRYGREIIESVNFVKSYGIKRIVLVGAKECLSVLEFIKYNNLPIILHRLHDLPSDASTALDDVYTLPTKLYRAGVMVALSYYGDMEVANSRNLSFNAGTAAANGLAKEEALQLITLNPAKILGIDRSIGSLEVGKDASFVISDGDLLDMKSSNITAAYLNGIEVDLNNKQKDLSKKHSLKYGFK